MVRGIGNLQRTEKLGEEQNGQRQGRLKKACAEFESMLLNEIMKGMRRTISKSDLIRGGRGEEIYEQLLDQELCRSLSGERGLGLAESLYQQLCDSLTQGSNQRD